MCLNGTSGIVLKIKVENSECYKNSLIKKLRKRIEYKSQNKICFEEKIYLITFIINEITVFY